MRWRILLSLGRWQLLAGRCPQCGWPKLAFVRDGIMRELPNHPYPGKLHRQPGQPDRVV
jgi:hypothetical protein